MKTVLRKPTFAFGIVLIGALLSSPAFAGCGNIAKYRPGAWLLPQTSSEQFASLLPISSSASSDPIVGMWHVTFTAQGNESGPPDGTPIDNALITWHSDGTELMASDRPPQDGNFCMGIWEKTGKDKYKVNHIPWLNNDTANAPSGIGNPTGPVRFFQEITLSSNGGSYHGTFILDAFDLSGNQVAHIVGVVKGTRVTINTTVQELL